MATMNISLPDKMREWIDQQVATGRFSNASDLVRDLIRDAQMRGPATSNPAPAVKSSDVTNK